MTKIQSIPQPVIAQVQGMATAAGCQLVATCDLAVASSEATFATPGVKIGLFCTTPMVALTRAIGRKRAMEMLLTGTRDRCGNGGGLGIGESGGARGGAGIGDAEARDADRGGELLHGGAGEAGVLPADRSGSGGRV